MWWTPIVYGIEFGYEKLQHEHWLQLQAGRRSLSLSPRDKHTPTGTRASRSTAADATGGRYRLRADGTDGVVRPAPTLATRGWQLWC